MMETLYTEKIKYMQEGGKIAAEIRQNLLDSIKPGMPTSELEKKSAQLFVDYNVKPSFKGYQGYPFTCIVCINDEVVHGMPSDKIINKGDLVTIDLGVFHHGFHTDTASTIEVGTNDKAGFLSAGREALAKAINQAYVGHRVGHISATIQNQIEAKGYNVVRAYVGHEVGRYLHGDIQIPCFGSELDGPDLELGMTLAVEVMYMEGNYRLRIADDGWTAKTMDGSLSAMFEHTIAVTQDGPLILTR